MIFPSRELGKLFILDINANLATSNLSHSNKRSHFVCLREIGCCQVACISPCVWMLPGGVYIPLCELCWDPFLGRSFKKEKQKNTPNTSTNTPIDQHPNKKNKITKSTPSCTFTLHINVVTKHFCYCLKHRMYICVLDLHLYVGFS